MNPSQQFYNAAKGILSKIENSIDKIENESFSPSIPSIPTIPSYATPPSIPPTAKPTIKPTAKACYELIDDDDGDDSNEIIIYKFIGNILKIPETETVLAKDKHAAVAMIFNTWEVYQFKPHILNLINYINAQNTLSDESKLKIIHLDLNQLSTN